MLNAIYLTLMTVFLRRSMKKFDEECFRKEVESIKKQNCVFNFAVVIELVSVVTLRVYRENLNCFDVNHSELGCDINSTFNFTLRMTFILLDTISKFIYCMYLLKV